MWWLGYLMNIIENYILFCIVLVLLKNEKKNIASENLKRYFGGVL
jgi:hypothetical protein